ncbi:hypothetical protein ACFX2G_013387 [Malus domestica]
MSPSIIDTWFNSSEKMAIFSSGKADFFAAKKEPTDPKAAIKATFTLAAHPVGQRRQSYKYSGWKVKQDCISFQLKHI